MICDKCYEDKPIKGMWNNRLMCEECLHNSKPVSVRLKDVEELEPTFKNLKKLWERK